MDPTLKAVCFIVAVILFVLAAFFLPRQVQLIAIGLAFGFLPFAWDAMEAA